EKKKIEDDFRKRKVKVDFISAREKIGLDKLLRRVYNTLEKYPREDVRIPETGSFTENDSISVIRIEDNVFKLENRKAEKFVAMMDFNNEETLEVFRRFLLANGINEFLKDNGVEEGDIVVIGGKDFVFEDDK
ncbi:MAG TPA: Obg family GTPase CgtA, partial [Candidatus Goldiibacteriota bacterium]|nr:Obg family GTPase CgtA [Candidatus Goldiibacteriota bacterium]